MRVPVERLRAFTEAVFQRADMSRADAAALTDVLVWSDLRGISALGVAKIPQYLGRLRAGVTSPTSARTKVLERDATAVLDAADTWGQIAGARAMRHAIGQARSAGVGVAAVRNTTSAGPLGYFALLAADQKMVGLAINNSPPLQAPWGGTTKVIGNQAFAIACPARRHESTSTATVANPSPRTLRSTPTGSRPSTLTLRSAASFGPWAGTGARDWRSCGRSSPASSRVASGTARRSPGRTSSTGHRP
jgi:LDH2 family malate/lactate/ureidoglycolate dehydrogenase